jgi:hypothetical protein
VLLFALVQHLTFEYYCQKIFDSVLDQKKKAFGQVVFIVQLSVFELGTFFLQTNIYISAFLGKYIYFHHRPVSWVHFLLAEKKTHRKIEKVEI